MRPSSSPARSTGISRKPARAERRRVYRPVPADEFQRYAADAARLILAGRLNKSYPDPYVCADYLERLAVAVSEGVYAGRVDPVSGLPAYQDLIAVQVDHDLAARFVAGAEVRLAAGRSLTEKVERKAAYYRRLSGKRIEPLNRLEVRLRRVDRAARRGSFEVVVDRFDPGDAVFERKTLLLDQTAAVWGEDFLARSGDYSKPTRAFRMVLERLTAGESELTFLLLSKIPGVAVEEITRGRVGPLWSPWAPAPAGWTRGGRGGLVLHLPHDRASIHLDADRDDDPFAGLYREFLSAATRPIVEDASRRLGYRTHKDRKFVADPEAGIELRRRLESAGTRNIVYTA